MKSVIKTRHSFLFLVVWGCLLMVVAPHLSARIFDNGVDSENLGKGDWVWIVGSCTNKMSGHVPSVTDIPSMMSYLRNQGMKYIIVKAGTGSTNYNGTGSSPQFNSTLVNEAHQVGLKIFAYTRSYCDNVPGEIALATNCLALGADGFVIDAEAEVESSRQGTMGPLKAVQLCDGIKKAFPGRFLAHSPFPYISLHRTFPFKEFGYYCDTVFPQDYWNYVGITPAQMVADMDNEWRSFHNSLTGIWTNAIKPIVPDGQADLSTIPASEITAFADAVRNDPNPVTPGGYKGINWWDAHQHATAHWPAIAAAGIGDQIGPWDIIVDNGAATVVGSWTVGTTAPDRYGADYRYKGPGTGSAYLQFTPNIPVTGSYKVFEMHPAGSNRTANAPVTIVHAGGTTTATVNQMANGGSWRLLGTFAFNAGTSGSVKIADNFSDTTQLVMADAVMFQYVQPAPTAPSGLTASAASGPVIHLNWADNSSNEKNFIVWRSTTSGGPYTPIAWVNANVASYDDTEVAANTTYYYVVRSANEAGYSANSNQAAATAPGEVADIIVDNQSALWTGLLNWTLGTASTDKFGADYRYRGSDGGTNYVRFTPNILTTGNYDVYEWHPQGANRTAGAPHAIVHSGGSTTLFVNQQTQGGQWNLLGRFQFNAGNSGYVQINDAFSDTANLVMADAIKFSFVPPPPAAPSGLTATTVSQTRINLAWSDNSNNEDSFIIARSTVSGGPYTDVAIVGANTTSFGDTGLSAATTYYYVVRASNAGGSSANSAQASATTLPNPPAAPSGLTATAVSSSQINLAWTDNSSNESSFTVARSTTSGGTYTDIATLAANTVSYNNTGLSANTTYYYVVRASNAGGSSANSNQASATTQPAGVPDIIIDNPAATVVGVWNTGSASTDKFGTDYRYKNQGTGAAWLQFTPNITSNANYQIYEWHAQGGNRSAGAPHVVSYNGGTATVNVNQQINGGKWNLIGTFNMVTGTSGNVKITDAFADGTQVVMADAIKFVYVAIPPAPAAPGNLSASPLSGTQIRLNWTDNATTEANFIVARSTTSGGPYTDIATLPMNTTSYTDSGLSKGTSYYYVVRAVNAGGSSANSAQASAVIPADIIIDNPAATVVGTWTTGTASTDKFGTDYRYKGPGTGSAFVQFTPTIVTPGNYQVYEWHPQGANRTTDGKHVVTFNGGSQTVLVNQQLNGGKWNLLGTFNFAAGSAGNIQINDNYTTGSVVLADGIKLVFVSP